MPHFRGVKDAFGAPGDEARWTGAAKDGIGTAHSFGGRVWFTIGRGILTEVYYPTVDRPQLRDLEFLFSDENGLFLEEKQDLPYQVERMVPSQGYRITRQDPKGRLLVYEGSDRGTHSALRFGSHRDGRKRRLSQNSKNLCLVQSTLRGRWQRKQCLYSRGVGPRVARMRRNKTAGWWWARPVGFRGSRVAMSDPVTVTPISRQMAR